MLNFLVSSWVQSPDRLVFRLSELEYSPGLTMNQNTEQRWWVLPVSLTVRVRLSCAVPSVPTTLIRAPAPYRASETATAAPTPTVVTTQVGFDPDSAADSNHPQLSGSFERCQRHSLSLARDWSL